MQTQTSFFVSVIIVLRSETLPPNRAHVIIVLTLLSTAQLILFFSLRSSNTESYFAYGPMLYITCLMIYGPMLYITCLSD